MEIIEMKTYDINPETIKHYSKKAQQEKAQAYRDVMSVLKSLINKVMFWR